MKKVFVIDSYAVAFRSFYAFIKNPLKNSLGEETSVVFGYANAIFRLILEQGADYIVIAKDLPGKNFRHDLYPEYKANRKPMPEEMQAQLSMLQEFMEISGIPAIGMEGYEADDVMARVGQMCEKEGAECYLVTKDKDMMQLVGDTVKLIHLERMGEQPTITDRAAVIKKFDVPPEQIRDLLALMGDSADNVPGVPKVGPKSAAKLLNEFGTVEGIYDNLDKITAKALNKNLTENKELAFLSQELVSLRTDYDLGVEFEDFKFNGFDKTKLSAFLERYELNSLKRHLNKLPGFGEIAAQVVDVKPEDKPAEYHLISDSASLKNCIEDLESSSLICLDTETSGLNPFENDLVGICLAGEEDVGYYIPLLHEDSDNLSIVEVKAALEPLLKSTNRTIVMHNAKFDLQFLREAGIEITANIVDSMLASYVLEPGARENSLDAQVRKRLGHEMIPITSLIGKGKDQITFGEIKASEAYTYAAEDAVYTWRLWKILESLLKEKGLEKPFYEVEMPLALVLTDIERNGIALDSQAMTEFSGELKIRIAELNDLIYAAAGQIFNIGSPKQLSEILFDVLGLKPTKKTKSGFSTDSSVLENLLGDHVIIEYIMEIRELEKLKNTYVDVLPTLVQGWSGRVHTHFNQVIAATGRLSSTNPNLQNIPVRTDLGKRIRSAFVPQDDQHVLLAADYSQIELRVLAHLSEDSNLVSAYVNNEDIHTQTAAAIYDVDPLFVDSAMRRNAKAINFGILYGMSAFRLSRDLGIPMGQAKDFIDGYFAHYPSITTFIESTVNQARKDGYVETMFGHRRYLPGLDDDNRNVQGGAERMAVNTPIQGTAAELIKKAMITIHAKLKLTDLRAKMLLQVHDELIFEVHQDDIEATTKLVKEEMENAAQLIVPLTVEAGSGQNWLEAH